MAGKKDQPDWDKFEVYKGEEPGSHRPAWLDRLMHYVVMSLLLVIAFGIGGSLFLFVSYQKRLHVTDYAFKETLRSPG